MTEQQQEFIVTARKWRPLRFTDVVGQEHITNTLQNAIKNARMHHAYLFCGPRGVGKTTTARILARAVNCANPIGSEPCNECSNCTGALGGRSLDVIEIDGASNNSVDDVRKLRENAKYPPSSGKYKMYIIDEVHMLSTSAFNALLKILEEPPQHLLFVFATTESHKLPATIISRCQRFDFRRMEIENIMNQLRYIAGRENIKIDEESLVTIAKKADGSMRDSQSIFDQVIAFCGDNVVYTEMADALHLIDEEFYFRLSDAISSKNVGEVFKIAEEVISKGYELGETLQGLLEHFRNVLTIKSTGGTSLIESSEGFLQRYTETAAKFSQADLLRYVQIITTTEQALKFASQPRIRFELALVQMAAMDKAAEISELISEIRNSKSGLSTLPSAPAAPARPINMPTEPEKKNLISNNEPEKAPVKAEQIIKEPAGEFKSKNLNLTANQIGAGWSDFVNKMITLDGSFSILLEFTPSFYNNEVVLSNPGDFVVGNLEKKKTAIIKECDEFYNASVSIKIVKDEIKNNVTANTKAKETQPITKQYNLKPENTSKENYEFVDSEIENGKTPVELELIKLFGAKEIKI